MQYTEKYCFQCIGTIADDQSPEAIAFVRACVAAGQAPPSTNSQLDAKGTCRKCEKSALVYYYAL